VYEAYLKGRYYLNQVTEEGLTNSLAYFQQAVERDPNYAPGYAGLADAYIRKVYIGTLPRMVLPKAKVAADKALQLDDTLAEAHAALAYVKAVYDHDWRGAEPEFRRAIELNPGNALVHYYYAVGYLGPLGRHDEAIAEMKKAVWLDPLSPIVNVEMGVTLFYARKYEQAIPELHKSLELDPNLIAAHWVLVNTYEQKAMYPEAVVEFQRLAAVMGYKPGFVASIHQAYVTSGVSGYWQKRLDVLKDLAKWGVVNSSEPAIVYLRLGEKEHALRSLEEGEGNPDARSIFINVNPALDNLRAEPRFQDLVRRLNLPPTDTQRARR
jgi:Tfp pilus assembly protein PilF